MFCIMAYKYSTSEAWTETYSDIYSFLEGLSVSFLGCGAKGSIANPEDLRHTVENDNADCVRSVENMIALLAE